MYLLRWMIISSMKNPSTLKSPSRNQLLMPPTEPTSRLKSKHGFLCGDRCSCICSLNPHRTQIPILCTVPYVPGSCSCQAHSNHGGQSLSLRSSGMNEFCIDCTYCTYGTVHPYIPALRQATCILYCKPPYTPTSPPSTRAAHKPLSIIQSTKAYLPSHMCRLPPAA
ncbi:hypothetical protein L211DRAFT_322444 [Terfezia boudieri ATCC MYA-4762]|uniref:Uncharacterized protein n=1 Tax=Terfezia boudieri ATCC MYA-4762 TaxID=1051890 RepID=A0A3N4LML0_9PEZI|nr:hypothetical protein L211DRAFT_322444 [Terfezia boudieri ATCC MYA-4762]